MHTHNQPFDDAMYSEVRKGPHYTPKDTPRSPPAQATSPPPAKPSRSSMGGLSELDNLLAMLNDTEKDIQAAQGGRGRGGEGGERWNMACDISVCPRCGREERGGAWLATSQSV